MNPSDSPIKNALVRGSLGAVLSAALVFFIGFGADATTTVLVSTTGAAFCAQLAWRLGIEGVADQRNATQRNADEVKASPGGDGGLT